jgi:hypothetical protein
MKRIEYCAAVLLALSCLLATACRGQGGAAKQEPVDPALAAAVDSMLPKLEVLAGLKRVRPVTLAQQSREQVRAYVESRLAEEMPPLELEGVRQTYIAFGLIPDTLNLKALLLDLYQEQVAGYYDPRSDKFFVVKGTPVGLLRPVLAHELVHALQDQHTNLDSLISRTRGNDRQSAAQAAIEGHATMVMFAFLAQQVSGQAIKPGDMPDISAQLKPALDAQNSQFPVFRRAPRVIRETMVFPYVAGAGFVQKLWSARADAGFIAPLGSLLPQSTEQVLHPSDHFLKTRDLPTEIRFPPGSKPVYENTLGELEIGILLSAHLGLDPASAAAGWDGDRYQLTRVGGKQMLLWQSVWDDAHSAEAFTKAYRQVAGKRTDRSIRVERNRVEGMEGVLVIDAEQGVDVRAVGAPAVRILR